MLTRDKYQEEKEKEALRFIEGLLSNAFENTNRTVFVVSDDYYENRENRPYQVCQIASELGLIDKACENYGIEYEFKTYPYDREKQKYSRSMFVFKRKEKQKELVKTNPLYSKCLHK